jgi:putative transposase
MIVLMLEYWRSEKRCIRQKEMNIQSDGSKEERNWQPIGAVELNPEQHKEAA